MMENIKWLFFDLGSTLVDGSSVYDLRFREIAEKTRIFLNKLQLISNFMEHGNQQKKMEHGMFLI